MATILMHSGHTGNFQVRPIVSGIRAIGPRLMARSFDASHKKNTPTQEDKHDRSEFGSCSDASCDRLPDGQNVVVNERHVVAMRSNSKEL
jgi:hypothetical protein